MQPENKRIEKQKLPRKEKCELALEERKCQDVLPIKKRKCQEEFTQLESLVDDEELELMELEAGPNSLTCCTHFANNGLRGCSLCKGRIRPPIFSLSSLQMLVNCYIIWSNCCQWPSDITQFTSHQFALNTDLQSMSNKIP